MEIRDDWLGDVLTKFNDECTISANQIMHSKILNWKIEILITFIIEVDASLIYFTFIFDQTKINYYLKAK